MIFINVQMVGLLQSVDLQTSSQKVFTQAIKESQ